MELLYEVLVMNYLTQNSRFMCPQYSIKDDNGKGEWRSLDFVVLDFEKPRVILAEVSTAGDVGNLVRKTKELHGLRNRENQEGIGGQGKLDDPGHG